MYAGWQQPPPPVSDEELAEITRRAAAIGIPAWRVRAALGVTPADGPAGEANPRGT